jgi:hypothetical protein
MANCFKCDKLILCAVHCEEEHYIWEIPSGAVTLQGGSNYGSAIYDSLVDGILVEVIICDNCLTIHKDKLREIERKTNG